MRIVSEKRLREFWEKHSTAKAPLSDWIENVRKAEWKHFSDVKKTYNSADVFGDCIIFNVGGNNFRLIAKIGYRVKIVFIRFVFTHSEYDEKKWQSDC